MIKNKINIMKYIFIILFIILTVKFFIITIHYYDGYSALAINQTNVSIKNPQPRGEIYDRNDNLIVGNKETKNLVYLSNDDISNEREWEIAIDISENFDMDKFPHNITKTDYQDLIIRENYYDILQRVSDNSEKYAGEELETALRSEVTKEDYNKLVDEYGKEAMNLKIIMSLSSSANPKVLIEDITEEEYYYYFSQFGNYGGCFVLSDWDRYYPYGDTMKSLLGTVGDIPEEDEEKYLSLGYSNSDQVGISYIEKEQEFYLKSTPQEIQIFLDDEGNISNYKISDEGELGNDIKLTIDMELQKDVEKILDDNLKSDSYKYHKTNYASISDPNTGEVLVMAGRYEDDDDIYDVSINSFSTAYEAGSIVKPAVLLMGYNSGTWEWNKHVIDKPIELGGGLTKGSYHDYGDVDEYYAIRYSSNVYFYTMFLTIAGVDLNSSFPAEVEQKYFDYVRSQYANFGLGTKTGIGFDNEIEGVKNSSIGLGLYMDLANGQYDTYTPLQLTQYIATLANGKHRTKLEYMYSINEPLGQKEIGREIKKITPQVLNVIDGDQKDINHVRDTLSEPSKSGGTTTVMADSRYDFGSKSGTSESFYYEPGFKEAVPTNNSSLIAYAPYDKPNIALSILMPYWTNNGNVEKTQASDLGDKILDACYEAGYI